MTVPPFHLSGVVIGVAMNHRGVLQALGESPHQPPYKAPPSAVVLYVKPRNTFCAADEPARVDATTPELEVGATLGIVIGRTACAVREGDALGHVAGYMAVADFSAPHTTFFRPQTRLKARDASCAFGPAVTPRGDVPDPDALAIRVRVDGRLVHASSTADHLRTVARLLADITDFMTLSPGDVVLAGVGAGAPRVRAGSRIEVLIEGLAPLLTSVAIDQAVAA